MPVDKKGAAMNKMRYLRIGAATAVLVVIFAATFAHIPIGTLCALCPVGFAELSVASGSIPWALLPGVLILLAIVFLLGRVFCSWVCPTSLLRNIFGGRKPRGLTGQTGICSGCNQEDPNDGRTRNNLFAQGIVLAVLLVISFIVRFPVFCLFCPIGLVFGTMFAVSRMLFTWQPGWDLVVFPALLALELFVLRRWCSAICPLGFFFGLMAKARTKLSFLPKVNEQTRIHVEGCEVCTTICPENICAATSDGRDLEDCTMCLDCKEHCPSRSISVGTAKPSSSTQQ